MREGRLQKAVLARIVTLLLMFLAVWVRWEGTVSICDRLREWRERRGGAVVESFPENLCCDARIAHCARQRGRDAEEGKGPICWRWRARRRGLRRRAAVAI